VVVAGGDSLLLVYSLGRTVFVYTILIFDVNITDTDTGNGNDVTTHASVVTLDDNAVRSVVVESGGRADRLGLIHSTATSYGQIQHTILYTNTNTT